MIRLLRTTLDWLNTVILSLHPRIHVGSKSRIKFGARLFVGSNGKIIIASNSLVEIGAVIDACEGIVEVGSFSTIQVGCVLYGHGGLKIGNGVRIATGTKIVPANHKFSDLTVPIYEQGLSKIGIVVRDNVWIGANCVITDGVFIDAGVVVGAGSVVTKDLAQKAVYAGVPAKMISRR